MLKKMTKRILVGLVILIGLVLIALFFLKAGPQKPANRISSALYYDYPLSSFANGFTMKQGNPNHPDIYSAEMRTLTGASAIPQYGIIVHSKETYDTSTTDICLNLQTGVVRVDTSLSGIEAHYEIGPPDKGGDYFDYLAKLAALKKIVGIVAAGCEIPEFGFKYPPRPELAGTLNYIDQVARQLKDAKKIDAVSANLARGESYLRLGTAAEVTVEYKSKEDREILVHFRDKDNIYTEVSAPVKAGGGTIEIKVPLPQSVKDTESTCIGVCIVPRGAGWAQKLAESIIKRQSQSGDCLFNLYLAGPFNEVMHAGKSNLVYLNWQVLGTRRIIVRVINAKGKTVAEQNFLATDGGENSRKVDLVLAEDTPRMDGYKIIVHIVPQGGSWSDFLSEKELPVRVE